MKSEIPGSSLDVPPGEAIGHQSEDFDLGQFGYKAELEVSLYRKLTRVPCLFAIATIWLVVDGRTLLYDYGDLGGLVHVS
jgi:hypothetical protein